MKLYDKYKELKEKDNNKIYLFRNGNFYIFLGTDADLINEYVVLKKTPFTKEIMKCGFPINSKDDYLKVFKNHRLNIEIVENIETENVIEKIKNINLENISPIDALNILYEIKKEIL